MPPRARKVPQGRLAAIQQEVEVPEPYVLTDTITIQPPTRQQMVAFRATKTDEEANKVLLGEHHDAIVELFDGQPEAYWFRFVQEVSTQFFGRGARDVEGGSEDSSESSTAGGTNFNGTSEPSSMDSTPPTM